MFYLDSVVVPSVSEVVAKLLVCPVPFQRLGVYFLAVPASPQDFRDRRTLFRALYRDAVGSGDPVQLLSAAHFPVVLVVIVFICGTVADAAEREDKCAKNETNGYSQDN